MTRLLRFSTGVPILASILTALLWAGGAFAETAEPPKTRSATFSMYCYWTGEATLGRVPGVVRSRIGHLDGAEIVRVDYDPAKTNVGELAKALQAKKSFYAFFAKSPEQRAVAESFLEDDEIEVRSGAPHFIAPKHSLRTRHPKLLELDLTEAQAIALNSWSYFGGPMPDVLTPKQKARWRELR